MHESILSHEIGYVCLCWLVCKILAKLFCFCDTMGLFIGVIGFFPLAVDDLVNADPISIHSPINCVTVAASFEVCDRQYRFLLDMH